MLVWDVVRVQGRIKSVFRSRGVACPGQTVYGHTHRATRMAQLPPASQALVSLLLAEYDALVELRKLAEKELLAECKRHAISKLLRTVPGLGPIRVARLIPVVGTRCRRDALLVRSCGGPPGLRGLGATGTHCWFKPAGQDGHRPWVLHENGTSRSSPHCLQRMWANHAMAQWGGKNACLGGVPELLHAAESAIRLRRAGP